MKKNWEYKILKIRKVEKSSSSYGSFLFCLLLLVTICIHNRQSHVRSVFFLYLKLCGIRHHLCPSFILYCHHRWLSCLFFSFRGHIFLTSIGYATHVVSHRCPSLVNHSRWRWLICLPASYIVHALCIVNLSSSSATVLLPRGISGLVLVLLLCLLFFQCLLISLFHRALFGWWACQSFFSHRMSYLAISFWLLSWLDNRWCWLSQLTF